MKRRTILIGLAVGGGAVAIGSAATCGRGASLALAPWSGPPPALGDVRMRALSYAILAPNAHNTQPWLLSLGDDFIDLHVDRARLLPETDPPYRQVHVSQGTFIELLVIALGELGAAPDVTYFPAGEYANDSLDDRPVARVKLGRGGAAKDPLFSSITARVSNKRAYDTGVRLSAAEIDGLRGAPKEDGAVARIIDEPSACASIAETCAKGMEVEVASRARNVETARWFRFSDREVEEKRDGFGMAQTGRGAAARWFAETFLFDRERAADPNGSFAKGAIDITRGQARSASAFGVVTTVENTRRAQVIAGRAYARVALTATSLGLAMHPMSQTLEEYPDMAATKATLERQVGLAPGGTVQMLFRLGRAAPTAHTARRDVSSFMRRA